MFYQCYLNTRGFVLIPISTLLNLDPFIFILLSQVEFTSFNSLPLCTYVLYPLEISSLPFLPQLYQFISLNPLSSNLFKIISEKSFLMNFPKVDFLFILLPLYNTHSTKLDVYYIYTMLYSTCQ